MKAKDIIQEENKEIMQKINQAVKDGDEEAFANAFTEFARGIEERVMKEARELAQVTDANILASRGVRQLTSEETKYYEALVGAMKAPNPKQALADLDVVMPKTTIDAVFEDLAESHPLLDAVNFNNTSGLIEMIVNTNEAELATWDTLTAEIVKELTSGFKKVNMSLNKLSAFLPVGKAMLDLGPVWMDKYVRTILTEAIYNGLENAIICGTGKNEPIGMTRQVGEGVTVTGGVYPEKETVTVESLDPVAYGTLLSTLTKTEKGNARTVTHVIMIVNPTDYLTKIMPATTIRGADGRYVSDVFPFPTTVIQSKYVAENRMIVGIGKRYFAGIGTAKSGKIEYSDEYRFLEDERVYLTKLYGHGEPLDNNAFLYCDITNLAPAIQRVKIVEEPANP